MFSKFFLHVLLLRYIYTYILNSIKDNNDTNFQKLPDNFNFELNGIQTVKPNLSCQAVGFHFYFKIVNMLL